MTILRLGDPETDPSDEFPVYARSGWKIPQEYPGREASELIRIRSEALRQWRSRVQLRSVSSYPYNCVGMIFAARRAWIEIDHVYRILEEDGYRQIPRAQVAQGDVVVYKDDKNQPSHVALIVLIEPYNQALNIQVISKWGKDAEFIHYIEDVVPPLGKPVEYYTERVES